MTAAVPTATSMKLKFGEFSSLADGTIEFAIEEAGLSISPGWASDADQTLAHMYLAAHVIMVAVARAESGTGQRIRSESIDGMAISYDTEGTSPDSGDYTTTPYGSKYLDLVKLNHTGISVV